MKKLAFWQLAMIALSLSAFFATRHFTVDKEIAAYVAILAMAIVMVYSILSCNLAASAATMAAMSIIAVATDQAVEVFFVPALVIVAIFMTDMGIGKKKLLAMYGVQFVIIFMPMLHA